MMILQPNAPQYTQPVAVVESRTIEWLELAGTWTIVIILLIELGWKGR
jgi:hypothetical protein